MRTAPALPGGYELPLRSLFARIGSVDAVGLEAHADALAKRSIGRESRLWALGLAVRALDLAALEATATPARARELCARAVRPAPADGPVAAVCVRPGLVPLCRTCLDGTVVGVAAVAGSFDEAVRGGALGADEVEVELDHGGFLSGRHRSVFDELARVRQAAGGARLKVILEPGGLGGYDNVRRASLLAIVAGADFVECSTGALPAALCLLEAIRDVHEATGRVVGFKAAGVATAERAIQHAVLVHETLGPAWLTPDRFRLEGPALLDDVLAELLTSAVSVA